jgi:hypothetical protein
MEYLGRPFAIQNTDKGWLVTWEHAVGHIIDGDLAEHVSFTVLVSRSPGLSIADVQTYALKRAVELLQIPIKDRQDRSDEA